MKDLWNGPFRYRVSDTTGKLKQFRVWAEEGEVVIETGNVGGGLRISVKPVKRLHTKKTIEAEAIYRAKEIDRKKAQEGWKERNDG